jgi:hypothetical protein
VKCDAAMNKKNGCIDIRIITRDSDSYFLGAHCNHQKLEVDPMVVEVIVAHSAVIFSTDVVFLMLYLKGMHC